MKRLTQENIVAVILLIIFGGVIYLCQDFGPRARMIPLPLAIFGIILTVIQLVWQNVRSTDELQMDLIAVQHPTAAAEEHSASVPDRRPEERPTWRRELLAYGIVALLIALVFAIGVMPAVFVFTGGYFLMSRHYGWLAGLVYTSLFTGVIYLLFVVALQVPPYHGLLAPLVERYF
ncbi:MAG: tripartite tricarboxylate transporter TctB family protein [Rhodospirillaceae bacterium]